jgi:putative intracellular protease/amidase
MIGLNCSKTDLISQGFIHTPELKALVDQTKPVAELDVAAFESVVVAGGQAPMFSFETATELHAKFAALVEAGKVAAALCHGCAVLAYAKDSQGRYIAQGRNVTGC